jgi:hypothetical protein
MLSALLPLGTVLACSSRMDVQLIRYPNAEGAAKPEFCVNEEVTVFEGSVLVPADCCAIGDVFIGDTIFSINCERERVLFEVRSAACRIGANAAAVRMVPDPLSNCYQVRAHLLSCATPPQVRNVQ